MNVTIKGVIVWDADTKRYSFKDWLTAKNFDHGLYQMPGTYFVLIGEHTINVDLPAVDKTGPQLAALDAREADLTAKYQAAKTEIEAQRQSLLALEFEG